MNDKDKKVIYNDDRYCVIFWEGGKIYTKYALLELRKKKIEKVFKDIEYRVSSCTYNEYLMFNVATLYVKMNAEREFRKHLGYIRIWTKTGYVWTKPE